MKNFYITTAIDYANGKPHIGHAYEKVLADTIARYQRLKGKTVHYLTGLDEYGQKVQQSAQGRGVTPQALCDEMATQYHELLGQMNISNDDYIRTTEERHRAVVQTLLQDLYDRGEIYKAQYQGFYSTKEEQFLQEKDKVDGKWPASYGEVVEITEENYFFKLSKYKDWLVGYIQSNPNFIYPKFRAKEVLQFLKEDVNDMCISRPKDRLEWGIELPFDSDYVTYVWFDALINYLSAVGYGTDSFKSNWPVDFHVIGKDILVPAHGVYWPIMLKAMGLDMPKTLLVHGWWLSSGQKMSKSVGNTIPPLELAEKFGTDAFRFFLLREMNVGQDSEFSFELFHAHYKSDLANDLGNLLSRLLNMAERYTESQIPKATVNEQPEQGLRALWEKQSKEVIEEYDTFQFHRALENAFVFIRGINRYAEIRAPWKLAKSEDAEDRAKLNTTLAYLAEGIRLGALLLSPVMPSTSDKINELLGIKETQDWENALKWSTAIEGNSLGEKVILFPRIELEETTA